MSKVGFFLRLILRCLFFGQTLLLASCATNTIGQLKDVQVDLKEEKIEGGLDKAIQNYQLYLDQKAKSDMTPEAIRRLADLKVKKENDALEVSPISNPNNQPDNKPDNNQAAPTAGKIDPPAVLAVPPQSPAGRNDPPKAVDRAPPASALRGTTKEAYTDFEKRTTSGGEVASAIALKAPSVETSIDLQTEGSRAAITLYRKLLDEYPDYEFNDQVLYQLARSYEEMGNPDEAMKMMNRLANEHPRSQYIEEIQFRRGEFFYVRRKFADAQPSYQVIAEIGKTSPYYEFALYKLGWTYYKQERYEEAMQRFITLLDHKIATGHDLDNPGDAFDEKRIDDTYRVMSLSLSNLGGAEAIAGYFKKYGSRGYEVNIYRNLGEYYLDKRRYSDAALTFKAFVKNNPYHKLSPYFDMWVVDSYKKGGFPKLVIEFNKEYVSNYGVKSAFWTRFDIATFKEVSSYVKTTLKELANFYHAQYQDKRFAANKDENFQQAVTWYREFLNSFPQDQSAPKDQNAPVIHYQLADLLLENKHYAQAALEYEYIAYNYPPHAKSSAAGYAAVYAHRESLALAGQNKRDRAELELIRREVIRSSIKFSDNFPKNEKAILVLSAAVEDIYGMKDFSFAATTARRLLAKYPGSDQPVRRAAWLIFAHSSFELGTYKDAEEGYLTALGLTSEKDPTRASVIENLAASFYKQGEQANKRKDYKLASIYFLLVGTYAPTATIRPVADFDAATALLQLKNWDEASKVMRSFRTNHPGHALQPEITKNLAFAYNEAGKLSLAAGEYERMAAESLGIGARGTDGERITARREALEIAAELYFQAKEMDKAYPIYRRYLSEFPKPLEKALEMRSKIAAYLKTRDNPNEYVAELKLIVDADARSGSERTDRTRYLGATAALTLAELSLKQFIEIRLVEPFDRNLLKKQEAMEVVKQQLEKLLDYEIDEITSAATYYLAEMYFGFNRSLVESARPVDLNDLEKEQYELSLEEQAYPFEEKTIQVHQKNLELMTQGIYNAWIERSLDKLAKMVPARYAKFETSSGYIEAIDTADFTLLINPKPPAIVPSPAVIK